MPPSRTLSVVRHARAAFVSSRLSLLRESPRNLSQSAAHPHSGRPCHLQRRNGRRLPVSSRKKSSFSDMSELPYGMRRVDYSEPPPRWIPHPPPPPPKNPVLRYFGATTVAACTALFVWIYFNKDETVYEYWKSVEQGDVPIDYDDDDDEEDLDSTNIPDEWDGEEDQDKRA